MIRSKLSSPARAGLQFPLSLLALGALGAYSSDAGAVDPLERTGAYVHGDFDGDSNVDIVASSLEVDCNKGAVYVLMGSGGSTSWTEDTTGILGTASCDDYFGASLAVGDFNNDGYDDLAVGTPGAADSTYSASGSVHIIYGSSTGLTDTGDQLWHQDVSGIEGVAEVYEQFGSALTAGDFNCDGYDDLAIGTPGEAVGAVLEAGAVNVIFGSSSGLSTLDSIWYQGMGGVDGTAEAHDYFGAAVAAGNFNGDSASGHACEDLAIGAPNEDESTSVPDSGFLYIIDGTTSGLSSTGDQAIDQNVTNVADTAEANDQLGLRLETVDLHDGVRVEREPPLRGDQRSNSARSDLHRHERGDGGLSLVRARSRMRR